MHPNSLLLFSRHIAPLVDDGQRILEIAPDDVPSSWRVQVTQNVEWEIAELVSEVDETGGRRWGGGSLEHVTARWLRSA